VTEMHLWGQSTAARHISEAGASVGDGLLIAGGEAQFLR
jgi:hypothetical protein